MDGIIVLDKPQDFTSFDAVAVVRGLTRERRIGHTGTLDPMATGVLPLLLGRATKAVSLLPDTDKAYEAGFRFGERSDTGDVTGMRLAADETPVGRGPPDRNPRRQGPYRSARRSSPGRALRSPAAPQGLWHLRSQRRRCAQRPA